MIDEKAQPEWLTRTCPVCGSKPGWGCANAVGNYRETPHAARVNPPAQPGGTHA